MYPIMLILLNLNLMKSYYEQEISIESYDNHKDQIDKLFYLMSETDTFRYTLQHHLDSFDLDNEQDLIEFTNIVQEAIKESGIVPDESVQQIHDAFKSHSSKHKSILYGIQVSPIISEMVDVKYQMDQLMESIFL